MKLVVSFCPFKKKKKTLTKTQDAVRAHETTCCPSHGMTSPNEKTRIYKLDLTCATDEEISAGVVNHSLRGKKNHTFPHLMKVSTHSLTCNYISSVEKGSLSDAHETVKNSKKKKKEKP